MIDFREFRVFSSGNSADKAANIFSDEIKLRTGEEPKKCIDDKKANVAFLIKDGISRDGYELDCSASSVRVYASGNSS